MKRFAFLCCATLALTAAACVQAQVAFLMEEPWGEFGEFNPTGHAAVYLARICADTPTRLRLCHSGEYGSVISRYHKVARRDWIVMPLIPYLYATDEISNIPQRVDKADVTRMRTDYWQANLKALAPARRDGSAPKGEWVQLVGSSFDRTIHGFKVETTLEQDERFIALFNDKRNVGHFNLFFHNCADFSRVVLNTYLPHAIRRNIIADAGITTPKQAAVSLVKYGRKHPELQLSAFVIPQVPGTLPRSIPIDGVSESLVKSKKYMLPLIVLSPEFAGVALTQYLVSGRSALPKNAEQFTIDAQEGGRTVRVNLPGETLADGTSSSAMTTTTSSTPGVVTKQP